MSKELTDFLSDLTINSDLAEQFENDREGTMRKHGLSEKHIDMVLNKKYDDIKGELESGYFINTNSFIGAFKKK